MLYKGNLFLIWLEPMIVTLTGASGAGKTTIAGGLRERFDNTKPIVSYTTRSPRPSDLPGEYAYISEAEFEKMRSANEFLWSVFVHGTHYGTALRSLEEAVREPETVFLMILTPDVIRTIRLYAGKMESGVVSFYVVSPPAQVLRARLQKRGDEPASIEKRIADCARWDKEALNSGIPYVFIRNDGEIDSVVSTITTEIVHRMSR
jgi:guanylate kinase